MTPIADMVRKLFEKGVDQEAILLAIEAAEQAIMSANVRGMSVDVSAERRREKDRLRKQIERENLRKFADFRGNPQTSECASLSKEEKNQEIKEERGERKQTVRGHRLPDDWRPTATDLAIAHDLVGEQRTAAELEKFKDHWKQQPGSRGVKLDWNAAWRNWTRRAAEYEGSRNGNRTGGYRTYQTPGSAPTRDVGVIASMGRVLERRRAARAATESGRQDVRGCGGPAGEPDADGEAAESDAGASGQPSLLP